jgi:hypothetical protein
VGVVAEVFGSGFVRVNANSGALPEAEENLKALGVYVPLKLTYRFPAGPAVPVGEGPARGGVE